jgi:hypothetical protein
VHLGHGQLLPWVLDAGLGEGIGRRGDHLGERRVVVVGIDRPAAGPATNDSAFTYSGFLVAMRVLGADDGRRRAIADPEQSKIPSGARHDRRAGDRLLRHFLAELGAGVERTVLVVLPRDARDDFLELGLVDAELLA